MLLSTVSGAAWLLAYFMYIKANVVVASFSVIVSQVCIFSAAVHRLIVLANL
jgi:hypothetical protein